MKVFLDTNIFLEYFEQRREYLAVSRILSAIEEGKLTAIVSVGCIYTLTYIIRMGLKRQNIHRPEQTEKLRDALSTTLSLVRVGDLNKKHIVTGISDVAFDDVEDSLQYQCALQNKCEVLVTINLRDYFQADQSSIEILSPLEFVNKYLSL
ncbi:MAG: PIN domain-containing protein [Muribaculaceae bacterium]|nr:PIN domain-containing protein [Muribaculaceae bacterium]